MNDTLVGRVMGAIAEYSRQAIGESGEPMQVEPDEEEMIRFSLSDDIVRMVTAARDAEIRELLLSSSMHDSVDEHLHGVVANGWLREVFRAGLDHIGLHGDRSGRAGVMSGKTNIDYHLEKLPWIEQQVFREIYKAIGYYNSHGAQFESPTDVFYGIRTNVLKIVDAMNDPRAKEAPSDHE